MALLRYFITSKAKRSILKLFLEDVAKAFYTREAARLTGEPLNAVRRELGYLEKAGLLCSYKQGNLKYFEVVREFPLLTEWRRIILETPDVVPAPVKIKEPLAAAAMEYETTPRVETEEPAPPVPPHVPVRTVPAIAELLSNRFKYVSSITLALIHGEAATSEAIPTDGINLLVIGDISKESLMETLAQIEDETGIRINLMRMTRTDFDYRNAQGDPFIRRIWSEKKLVVKGRH